jgi:hypothetical protein
VPAEVHFYVATPGAEHACPEPLKSRAERLDIGLVRAGGSLPHCSAAFDMKGGKRSFAANARDNGTTAKADLPQGSIIVSFTTQALDQQARTTDRVSECRYC